MLRLTSGSIEPAVRTFINHVLVGTALPDEAVGSSDLTDHVYPLIYELHKIDPGLLLHILPNICAQLKTDEEDLRLRAVKLLGQLFSSQYTDYASQFQRNFREYLSRFIDVSPAIRIEMIDCCSLIMKKKPVHKDAVEGKW